MSDPTPPAEGRPPGPDQVGPGGRRRRVLPGWPIWAVAVAVLLLLVGAGAVWAWNLRLPYYALSPGPTQEVVDLISVDEQAEVQVFAPQGDLYFLTVLLQPVNVYEYLEAWLDPRVDVVERENIRPPGTSEEELRRINRDLMDESKTFAVCVALQHLDFQARCQGQGARVMGFVEGTPAASVLQEGDVIVRIAGEAVNLATDAVSLVAEQEIGERVPITVVRDGRRVQVEVRLVEHVQEPGRPMVGILLDTVDLNVRLPFDITIDSHNVGGPSAGMMYTLGVIDLLSEGNLTHGLVVAGTGTIRLDGEVGEVGGVRQKVFAARAAGADYVLVPEGNYQEALGATGGEIEVVAVSDLDEALRFLGSLERAASS
ncbi:MAG: PDZ domain-containing protein [Actinomycetota bacterium]|nr:PDZ domain-containing protein [Actinomycetota bacterium]